MSKFSKVFKSVTKALGLSAPAIPALPAPEIPAPPAPTAITDTGAQVSIGTSADIKNQRVSGRTSGMARRGGDPLGGLTIGGGLRI